MEKRGREAVHEDQMSLVLLSWETYCLEPLHKMTHATTCMWCVWTSEELNFLKGNAVPFTQKCLKHTMQRKKCIMYVCVCVCCSEDHYVIMILSRRCIGPLPRDGVWLWSQPSRWESLLHTHARSCHTTTWVHWTKTSTRQQQQKNKQTPKKYSRMYFEPTHDTTRPLKHGSLALSSDISSFTTL